MIPLSVPNLKGNEKKYLKNVSQQNLSLQLGNT